MVKLLIGGSPCTFWSIAQKNNRETTAEGMGWELFKNYLIAKEKFKPDIFLYENNKSAAQAIKDQIKKELNVWDGTLFMEDNDVRYTELNASLFSAQNRQRFYVHNCGDIETPQDKGIVLKDILESGCVDREKAYPLLATYYKKIESDYFEKHHSQMVCEPINTFNDDGEKSRTLMAGYYKYGTATMLTNKGFKGGTTGIAEPVNVTKDGKSQTIKAQYQQTSPRNICCYTSTYGASGVAEPVRIPPYANEEKARPINAHYSNNCGGFEHRMFSPNPHKQQVDMIAQPIRVGDLPNEKGEISGSQATRIYSADGKSVNLVSNGGGQGAKTGLYALPIGLSEEYYKGAEDSSLVGMTTNGEGKYRNGKQPSQQYRVYSCEGKSQVCNTMANDNYICPYEMCFAIPTEWNEDGEPIKAYSFADEKIHIVYKVQNGMITIKDKQYPIKLADGFYIIRKLTVKECCRLQTMPDDYFLNADGTKIVSDSQAYKGLGNGWCADVVEYILSHKLKDVPRDEEIVVLSMYDGIGTGRYILDKMGFTNVKYFAYEIDAPVKKVSTTNYPDIIQCGDAFDIRHPDWTIGY